MVPGQDLKRVSMVSSFETSCLDFAAWKGEGDEGD